jgi:hypothetical protein
MIAAHFQFMGRRKGEEKGTKKGKKLSTVKSLTVG